MAAKRRRASGGRDLPGRILDVALAMADEVGWERVRLRVVAERMGIPMAEVAAVYRDLDAIGDALFRRGRAAMLAPAPAGFRERPPPDRILVVIARWLEALAPHRRVAGQVLRVKLYPSHPHHWVPLIFDLSRTVQWIRDAAGLDAVGVRRQVEEVGLTALFLLTLAEWLGDSSPHQERTRGRLSRRLAVADRAMARLWPGRSGAARGRSRAAERVGAGPGRRAGRRPP